MVDVLLHDPEQAAVRAILASEPVPGGRAPGEEILQHVARLIACDAIGLAVLDAPLRIARGASVGPGPGRAGPVRPGPGRAEAAAAESAVGIQELDHTTAAGGTPDERGVAVLALGVRNGPHHVVQLWMCRRTARFTRRDRALLELVAPALERVMRERPMAALPPSLTIQERRVLLLVAEGLSNAEIADRLVVASSTVGKHLENAYRKLGVSSRHAAVHVLQGGLGG
jgi:DNA-binding CsgD family transcriptional regulator